MLRSWKQHSVEEIVGKLKQARMLEARGASMSECAHAVGVGRATYYRWRQQYAGIKRKQAPKVRELEREIARLRSAIKGIERGK